MESLTLHFIRPWWLLAVPLALILPLAWRRLRRPSGDWARVCDPHLLRWLSVGEQAPKAGSWGAWAAALVLALSSIALSGPSWERLPDVSYSARDARVLVLDLSASMLAQDLKPDRLTRVRYRLSDLLEGTEEGQVGLVAYAGDAYVVSPLTSDTNTIANMLPALRPDIVPVAGSRADRAMELAAELLQRSGGTGGGEILLVTDDADLSDADLAARLAGMGVSTSVLGVGTVEGAPIPSGGGFVSDSRGNVVIARLGVERLRAVATAGGGRFTVLAGAGAGDPPWKQGDGSEFGLRDDGLGERWRDAGPFLVLLLLPLVALGFRRGVLFLAPLALLPTLYAPPAAAGFWDDLWQRRDQQAQSALRDGRPGEAVNLAVDPEISGEAWYRSGEYPRAMHAWSQSDSADAHYNRGNALAQAGDLDGAIGAYDAALALNPDMEDALFNKALLEQMKQQQEQQGENQEGEGEQEGEPSDSGQQGEAGEQQEEQQEGEGEPGESEQESGEEGDNQAAAQQMQQAWSEEDAQAMEQWLRRIPDDPGGLLRRKFRNEHQRRGAPEDEKESW